MNPTRNLSLERINKTLDFLDILVKAGRVRCQGIHYFFISPTKDLERIEERYSILAQDPIESKCGASRREILTKNFVRAGRCNENGDGIIYRAGRPVFK